MRKSGAKCKKFKRLTATFHTIKTNSKETSKPVKTY